MKRLSDPQGENSGTARRTRAREPLAPAMAARLAKPSMQSGLSVALIPKPSLIGPTRNGLAPHCVELLLDSMNVGVAVLNPQGDLRYTNRKLRELSTSGDGFRLSQGRLFIGNARFVPASFVRPNKPDGKRTVFNIERPSGLRPYVLALFPMQQDGQAHPASGEFGLFVIDPQEQTHPNPEEIARLFGLTKQEAKIAALLADGHRLEEAASMLQVAVGTARYHLKNVLSKTNTRRQAELVGYINCLSQRVVSD